MNHHEIIVQSYFMIWILTLKLLIVSSSWDVLEYINNWLVKSWYSYVTEYSATVQKDEDAPGIKIIFKIFS